MTAARRTPRPRNVGRVRTWMQRWSKLLITAGGSAGAIITFAALFSTCDGCYTRAVEQAPWQTKAHASAQTRRIDKLEQANLYTGTLLWLIATQGPRLQPAPPQPPWGIDQRMLPPGVQPSMPTGLPPAGSTQFIDQSQQPPATPAQ